MRYQVGPYDVKAKVNYLGPIVWTDAYTDQEGNRRTDFANLEAAPLPPQLSPEQQSLLAAGIVTGLLHDFVLPELTKRYQRPVSEQEFLCSPMWQSQVRQMLITVPVDGPPMVSLNEEVAEKKIPSDCGHMLLLREGYTWQIKADWLPLFPAVVQKQVRTIVTRLAEAILRGDEKSAGEMAGLWFPGLWEDSPGSIRQQFHKEIYVLLFRLANYARKKGFALDFSPLDAVQGSFPRAVEELKGEYTLEYLQGERQQHPGFASLRFEEFREDIERLFSRANLSDQELLIVRLEAALAVHHEDWSAGDKEKFLGMKQGIYTATLYRARQKLMSNTTQQDRQIRRLLEAIYGKKGGE